MVDLSGKPRVAEEAPPEKGGRGRGSREEEGRRSSHQSVFPL